MSGELADSTITETPTRSRRLPELSDPAVTFVTSSAVWILLLVGIVRFPYDLTSYVDAMRDPNLVGWAGVALLALLVAIIAGFVYIVDHRRRRFYHPRGYRQPQKARFTVVEVLGALLLIAYTAIVAASAAQLGILVVEARGLDTLPAPEEIAFLVVVAVVYFYHLVVLPVAGLNFLASRRHKRRYPDERDREGHGFYRTARALLVANSLTLALLVVVELGVVDVGVHL